MKSHYLLAVSLLCLSDAMYAADSSSKQAAVVAEQKP